MSNLPDIATSSSPAIPSTLVRALGAAEGLYQRMIERTPVHFVIAMEYPMALTPEQVASALRAVQLRHPLLAVQIEDDPAGSLGFYRPATVPVIELTLLTQPAHEWQHVAAAEMERRFEASAAPLIRATLISDGRSSTILLTIDHTIADGVATIAILRDLNVALNGHRLEPLPVLPAKEELVARAFPDMPDVGPEERPAPDPRMASPRPLMPVEGIPRQVRTDALYTELTARLVQRCRAEGASVHTALVAAASRVRSTLYAEDFVRVATVIDIRGLIGAGDGDGAYFRHTRTGMSPHDGATLWDQARRVKAELAAVRPAAVFVASSKAIQQFASTNPDTRVVEGLLASALSAELAISNLGVVDMERSGPIHPAIVWGAVAPSLTDGELTLGIATFEGRLRVTALGNTLSDEFLPELRQTLSDACR